MKKEVVFKEKKEEPNFKSYANARGTETREAGNKAVTSDEIDAANAWLNPDKNGLDRG